MWIGCGNPALRSFFQVYGRLVARHPRAVLSFSLLVLVITLCGLFRFRRINDLEHLYSPMNSPAKAVRQKLKHFFPEDAEHQYSPLRRTTFGQYVTLIVTAADGNVLAPEAIADVRRLDDAVRATKTIFYRSDGTKRDYTYDEICCRNMGQCLADPVLHILQYSQPSQIRFPIHQIAFPSGNHTDVFLGYSLGGVGVEGGNTSAKAWKLQYALQPNHTMSYQWQSDAIATVQRLNLRHISVFRYSAKSIRDDLHLVAKRASPLFLIALFLIVAFSAVSLLSGDWLEAKPDLAVAGVVSSCLAIPSAFGLCSQLGIPGTDIIAASPFLIVGIGIDDTFVMVAAWRQTDHRLTVEDRMGQAFADAALAVTITSLTDVLSFAVGAFTQFRSVQIFCAFTGVGIAFDFFYQLTFLGACMAFSGRREALCKHPLAFTTVIHASEAGDRSILFRWFCTGGSVGTEKRRTPLNISFFRDTWVDMLNHCVTKALVFFMYAGYLGVALWGCTRLRQGFHMAQLAIDSSYVSDYYVVHEKYFHDYDLPISILMYGCIKPWKREDWDYMEQILRLYERESDYFYGANFTSAWTRQFENTYGVGNVWNRINFTGAFSEFIARPENKLYALDVKWNNTKTAIVATRFHVMSKNLGTTARETALVQRARQLADNMKVQRINVTVFHPQFIFFDKYINVLPTTIRNVVLATIAMFAVSLLLIPSLACSVSVALSIASICTGVVGYMTWWDVNLDNISMVDIIMSVGFSVDYSAHITSAFVTATGDGKVERLRNALAMVGYPMVQCAASTVIAISILNMARGYMMRTFFKIMFLVVCFGIFHGLLVIPEILLVVGGLVKFFPRYPRVRSRIDPTLASCFLERQMSKTKESSFSHVGKTGDSADQGDVAAS